MARLRLIAGKGKDKVRMVVPSVRAIREKWPIKGTGRSEGVLFYLQSSEHEFIIRD